MTIEKYNKQIEFVGQPKHEDIEDENYIRRWLVEIRCSKYEEKIIEGMMFQSKEQKQLLTVF